MATLRQLQVFTAVAEHKKMSETAKHLYISQPTISQIISDLETEYSVVLFERQPKELKITPAGKILLSSAQQIVSINEQLNQAMHNLHSKRPLRVGATLTIGNSIMSSLVEQLSTDHPDIDISVFVDNTKTIEHRIIHNELDIALVEGIIFREEILTEPIIDDYLEIICGPNHPFASRTSVSIEELRNQDFIMREKGSGTRAIFENLMTTNHIPITTKWECSSGTAIIDAVRHNLGLGVLSRRCFQDYVAKKEVHSFTIHDVSLKRFFYVCYNQSHPMSSQMIDFITAAKGVQDSYYPR